MTTPAIIRTLDENPLGVAVREQTAGVTARADSAVDLLREAVRAGTPVEQLSKLVELQERMEQRDALRAFSAALAAFQAECQPIHHNKTKEKDPTRKGGTFSYTWASLDEIARTVNPILAKNGLGYSWDTRVDERGAMLTCTCTVRHSAGHSSSSSFTLPTASEAGMSAQQKFASADKFAKRMSLVAALGLTTTGDEVTVDEDAEPSPITDDQLETLENLIESTGADRARYLKFLGIDALGKLPATDYDRAASALRQKAGKS